jgi:hypothetical protein
MEHEVLQASNQGRTMTIKAEDLGTPKPRDIGDVITDISDSLIYYSIRWDWPGGGQLVYKVYIHNKRSHAASTRFKVKTFTSATEAVDYFNRKVNE